MPNAKVLSEKQAIVAQLTEKIQNAAAGVLVDYKGITVEEDTKLRKSLREAGVDYRVIKNTYIKKAAAEAGLDGFWKAHAGDLHKFFNSSFCCVWL